MPNHYHFLAATRDCIVMLKALGKLHGRTSFRWNGEDCQRGRQVWCKASETVMKSDSHFWATLNYVNHNAVKHGLAAKWQDWLFSSAAKHIESLGHEEAERLWHAYPVGDYGKGWDD